MKTDNLIFNNNIPKEYLDKKTRRFMGMGAAWNYISMQQAIEDAHTKSAIKMEEKMKALYTDLGFESS